jgi:hypothetical protein
MVAGSFADPDPHHFEKLDPYAHQSERSHPDPHQSERSDPDSHQSDKIEALDGHFGLFFFIYGSNSVTSEWWDPDPHQRAVDTKISYV